jgi:hypothetical protein
LNVSGSTFSRPSRPIFSQISSQRVTASGILAELPPRPHPVAPSQKPKERCVGITVKTAFLALDTPITGSGLWQLLRRGTDIAKSAENSNLSLGKAVIRRMSDETLLGVLMRESVVIGKSLPALVSK